MQTENQQQQQKYTVYLNPNNLLESNYKNNGNFTSLLKKHSDFHWLTATTKIIRSMTPISFTVIFTQCSFGARKNLKSHMMPQKGYDVIFTAQHQQQAAMRCQTMSRSACPHQTINIPNTTSVGSVQTLDMCAQPLETKICHILY